MKHPISTLFCIGYFGLLNMNMAQDCGAQKFYESGAKPCTDSIDPIKCVSLDITESYDFDGLEMEFMWDMGDGQTKEGLAIEHCYEHAGKYEASLTVTDLVTKVEMENELVVDVFIRGEFDLELGTMEPKAGTPFTPIYQLNYPDNFTVTNYFWSLGDGSFACGANPEFTYFSANEFPMVLNVELVNGGDTIYLCQQSILNVELPDPTGGSLDEYFDQLEVESRFLQTTASYQILEDRRGVYLPVSSIDSLTAGRSYSLLVFKGNLLIKSSPFSVRAGDTNYQKFQALQEAGESVLSTPVVQLSSVIFKLNQTEFSKREKRALDENIEILNEFPFLKILIGSYTHTGGSYSRNIDLSKNRSEEVKSYIVEAGVDSTRIVTADPSKQRALINTCLTIGCDYEVESLNRRSDFKIVGVTE